MSELNMTEVGNLTEALLAGNGSAIYGSTTMAEPNCPEYSESDWVMLDEVSFWMEGVVQITIAVVGILFNIFSSLVLCTREMRNPFNLLLVALSCFDSCYLTGSILESVRKCFGPTDAHTLLFPYLLYPGQMIAMTASDIMTVAIAAERYVAVHYPLDYNQSMTDENATCRRVLKYVVPVLLFSIVFNAPKFLEAEIKYHPETGRPMLHVSELRRDPEYSFYYNNCLRLLILAIIPFLLLVFFNTKIYQDIQVRRRRRRPARPPMSTYGGGPAGGGPAPPVAAATPAVAENSVKASPKKTTTTTGADNNVGQQQQLLSVPHSPPKNGKSSSNKKTGKSGNARKGSAVKKHRQQHNANRRRYEDNLAIIFMGIVLFFLISHLPRIFMGIHEVVVYPDTRACEEAGLRPWAPWVHIVTNVSHLLLVINSSVNSVIYCSLSSRFRAQVIRLANRFMREDPRQAALNARNCRGGGGGGQSRAILNNNNGGGGRPAHVAAVATANVAANSGAVAGHGVTVNIVQPSDDGKDDNDGEMEETVADIRSQNGEDEEHVKAGETDALMEKSSEEVVAADKQEKEMRNGLTQTTQV